MTIYNFKLENGFQKTIIAFTNSTVINFFITKPVWSHDLALSAWTLNKHQSRLKISACKSNSSH